uniref:Uncharacterized protein n=1 Tax=Panthera leo TaxID=9689 RepID=A0A8C8WB42_PANLE
MLGILSLSPSPSLSLSIPFPLTCLPNQNQTRNCWQNFVDFHHCENTMVAKGGDVSMCEWYHHVCKSLCPIF